MKITFNQRTGIFEAEFHNFFARGRSASEAINKLLNEIFF